MNTTATPTIPTATTPRFLSRKEAAQYLRLTPGTLANLHLQGKGPVYYRRGNTTYYLMDDLVEWIMAGKVNAGDK